LGRAFDSPEESSLPLSEVGFAKPHTILEWYRRLVAQKFDRSRYRAYPGRPRVSEEVEALVVRFARENRGWGYDRIVGALGQSGPSDLGPNRGQHPAPAQPGSSARADSNGDLEGVHPVAHRVLAGADFFTVEVLTWRGLLTYYVRFFIEVGSRRVTLGGITRYPNACWME
jgi:hypothetical protein